MYRSDSIFPYLQSSALFKWLLKFTPFLYEQYIFDPRPENCLSFSKKSPQKIV